ncbi:MAG: hypothetical protein RLZZ312_1711, partial [Bacteroidota bacterium]
MLESVLNMYDTIRYIMFIGCVAILASCKRDKNVDGYVAYFGGEISNPTSEYVFFCKNAKVIDTIRLNKNNTFSIKFDSLTPGLYSFKHEPEYQYIYFDKNDSLMVTLNTNDFDKSIVFSGRGEEKNNFLNDLYLQNEVDKNKMFSVIDKNFKSFNKAIDSSYSAKTIFYNNNKKLINWSSNFDLYAKATLDFFYFSMKEMYPVVHKMRTGENIESQIPSNYYAFRKNIDFNDQRLSDFAPFSKYTTNMLNNVALSIQKTPQISDENSLDFNIQKLRIADTLFKNQKIKNRVVDNIAITYLLEDQNIQNTQDFLSVYRNVSNDLSKQNEILKIGQNIQTLNKGNLLPEVSLVDEKNNKISLKNIIKKKSIIFFWTDCFDSHMIAAHKKVMHLEKKHPNYQFIAVNVDDNQQKWCSQMKNNKFKNVAEYRCTNFENLKEKWVINKIHRTLIINANGTIDNAFVS